MVDSYCTAHACKETRETKTCTDLSHGADLPSRRDVISSDLAIEVVHDGDQRSHNDVGSRHPSLKYGHGRCLALSQMFMDLVLEGLLREHLMVAPLLVVVGITEQLVTMGAEDFKVGLHAAAGDVGDDVRAEQRFHSAPPRLTMRTLRDRALSVPTQTCFDFVDASQDFVVSFFVELSVMMLERLYLDPGAKEVWSCSLWNCSFSASFSSASKQETNLIEALFNRLWCFCATRLSFGQHH